MWIEKKNWLLEDLESIRQDLVSRKCLAYAYFLMYRADMSGHLIKRSICPTTLLLRLWRIENVLGPTIASSLPCLDHWEAMNFSAFNAYNAILAIVSFQITRGRDQLKHLYNARAFRATSSMKTLTRLEQLVETFAFRFSVSCKTLAVPCMH